MGEYQARTFSNGVDPLNIELDEEKISSYASLLSNDFSFSQPIDDAATSFVDSDEETTELEEIPQKLEEDIPEMKIDVPQKLDDGGTLTEWEEKKKELDERFRSRKVVNVYQAQKEELEVFTEQHTYDDGTIVQIGHNQGFFHGNTKIIKEPLGNQIFLITILYENNETHLVLAQYNVRVQENREFFYNQCYYYSDREDGLIKQVINIEQEKYLSARFYSGRSDHLIRIEEYNDKNVQFFEQNGTITSTEVPK